MSIRSSLLAVLTLAAVTPVASAAPTPPTALDRSVEPVVLRGSQFPTWSAGPDPTFREPQVANDPAHVQSDCRGNTNPYDPKDPGDHNCYQDSRLPRNPLAGAPMDRILGYRWEGGGFVEFPLQVDERFTRYISNNTSGFAFYSGVDAHNTYAWDREGFRFTGDESQYVAGGNPCLARPAMNKDGASGPATTPDPVKGLDDDDELVFMWNDAGGKAQLRAELPGGIDSAYEIEVADPSNPEQVAYAYVMLAKSDGPRPSFDATNGYVRYERDPNADLFLYSQSSYGNYGAAPKGPYCNRDGSSSTAKGAIAQRRPIDTAWIKTPRYHFRYDGRWLMTQLRISPDDSGLSAAGTLGPDIIDQWKARAFQQRPGGTTPCCGYEEEVNNWGGSSILMGERAGPVRAIRAAWGADSSTNNIKTETFYREDIRFGDALRVHVIPPFDGIYVQWDYNAGKVSRYYNKYKPEGVPADGKNDESFGNTNVHIAQDRIEIRDDDPIPVIGPQRITVPVQGGDPNRCDVGSEDGICNDLDFADPTFSGPAGGISWEQVGGQFGTVVTRWTIKEHTGGDAYSLAAQPYYRDDSCFDDGTGSDPGPHLRGRSVDVGGARADREETWLGDASTYLNPATGQYEPRICWTPEHGDPALDPAGARRFWQGDVATHGLHLRLIAESDNAYQTVPIDEIVSEQRMVVLRGDPGNVGERYGNHYEFPLTTTARVFA